MARYKLILEFDGARFVGWQRQENGLSVQEAVETAAQKFCGERVTVHGAGRTDAGVHALAMAAHLDLEKKTTVDAVRDALNFHMKPLPVAVLHVSEVSEDFHARFSCLARAYEYRIVNRRPPLTLDRGYAWRVTPALDAVAMDRAGQALVGRHDFTTFRAAACQAASPVKSVDTFSVLRHGEVVLIRCSARSFLHHQVRSFAGSLVEVGLGRWSANDLEAALGARDRKACGPVAPPEGLYFAAARYENA